MAVTKAKKTIAKPAKKATGRPAITYRKKQHCESAKMLAVAGFTQADAAKAMAMSVVTFRAWLNKYPDFHHAWFTAAAIVDAQVESALLKRALGYEITVKEFKKTPDGIHDIKKEIHVEGDVNAQTFWLANRQAKRWKLKPEETFDDDTPITGFTIERQTVEVKKPEPEPEESDSDETE